MLRAPKRIDMTNNRLILINVILFVGLISLSMQKNDPASKIIKLKSQDVVDTTYLDNWRYKTEIDLYKYYQKDGKIVMLGNSITYLVDWNELLNREDVINRGIGSDITEGFLARIEYVFNVKPTLCFIMGGVNDIAKGIRPEKITLNLGEIARRLNEKDIKPIIFSILYAGANYPNYIDFNKSVKHTNMMIKEMCIEKEIKFFDLNVSLSDNEVLQAKYTFDGLHLTGLGYDKWREIMLPIIERELK